MLLVFELIFFFARAWIVQSQIKKHYEVFHLSHVFCFLASASVEVLLNFESCKSLAHRFPISNSCTVFYGWLCRRYTVYIFPRRPLDLQRAQLCEREGTPPALALKSYTQLYSLQNSRTTGKFVDHSAARGTRNHLTEATLP